MEVFIEWLETELKNRGWQPAELSRQAGLNTGSISRILNGTRKPGSEICVAIAQALNMPAEEVFRQAGLLPSKTPESTGESELLHLYRQLDRDKQKLALATLRVWVEGK
jgi:transcriptional regulator with XRE-family HTH domain